MRLHGRHPAEQFLAFLAACRCDDFADVKPVFRERAGLVEEDAIDLGQAFEYIAGANEEPAFGEPTEGRPDRERSCQADRARARHEQHRHGVEQPGVPASRRERGPVNERAECRERDER